MVTSTISGTYHHEAYLALVNSFNNIYFKFKVGTRLRRGRLGGKASNASTMFCGSLFHFIFSSKYVRWLYVPPEGHITTYRSFFAK